MQIEPVLCNRDAGRRSLGQNSHYYLGAHAHFFFFSLSCPGGIRTSLPVGFVLSDSSAVIFNIEFVYYLDGGDNAAYVYTANPGGHIFSHLRVPVLSFGFIFHDRANRLKTGSL